MEKEAFLKKFRMNKRFPFKQDQGIEFGCPFKEGFLKVGCLANAGPSGLGLGWWWSLALKGRNTPAMGEAHSWTRIREWT